MPETLSRFYFSISFIDNWLFLISFVNFRYFSFPRKRLTISIPEFSPFNFLSFLQHHVPSVPLHLLWFLFKKNICSAASRRTPPFPPRNRRDYIYFVSKLQTVMVAFESASAASRRKGGHESNLDSQSNHTLLQFVDLQGSLIPVWHDSHFVTFLHLANSQKLRWPFTYRVCNNSWVHRFKR